MNEPELTFAFCDTTEIARGPLREVLSAARAMARKQPESGILIFNEDTGQQIDFDPREIDQPIQTRSGSPLSHAGPGRPKLGVVGREVTLLPRHWEWLNAQPGGASVALRKLVEAARRVNSDRETQRLHHERAYKVMTALAGNLPGYEEALRSLFANDQTGVTQHMQSWPVDVQHRVLKLAFPPRVPASSD